MEPFVCEECDSYVEMEQEDADQGCPECYGMLSACMKREV